MSSEDSKNKESIKEDISETLVKAYDDARFVDDIESASNEPNKIIDSIVGQAKKVDVAVVRNLPYGNKKSLKESICVLEETLNMIKRAIENEK